MNGDSQPPKTSEPAPQPASGEPPPSKLFFNATSVAGGALAVGNLSAVAFFLLHDFIFGNRGAYTTLLYLPFLLLALLGVGLVAFGMIREARRRKQGQPPSLARTVSFDLRSLARPKFVGLFLTACGVASFFVLGMGIASVDLIELSESSEFCGAVCHSVMEPEAVTHAQSAHARVQCVACHVGPGAESYVRAKLNGLRQIYAVASGKIQIPIPTPIHNQRPARYTCEECHSQDHFRGEQESVRTYFRADEANTPVRIRMLTNVGGASNGVTGELTGSGIHYHMALGHTVAYIARDHQRQEIAWVRITHPNGKTTEYNHAEAPLTDEEHSKLPSRVMDCLDCHNRTAHHFESPLRTVNEALDTHLISRELPFIKREASRALDGNYPNKKGAGLAIAEHLATFYRENYPEIASAKRGELAMSIRSVQLIYEKNSFPELKASWDAHPDNLGHRDSPGCFRCHNDEMESEEGDSLFVDCQTCHIILAVGEDVQAVASHENGVDFWHPEDEDTLDDYTVCSDCHDGGASLYAD